MPQTADTAGLFKHLFETSKDAVVALNAKGQITQFSPSAARLFRVQTEQALDDKFEIFLVEAQREGFRKVLAGFFEKGEKKLTRTALEATVQRGDAPVIRCEVQLSAFESGGGTQVLVIARDVTERRQAAQRLHEAQKMEILDRLAGEVAHDVNNLLLAVGGHAALAGMASSDAQKKFSLDEIARLVRHGAELMKELRAIGRGGGKKDTLEKAPLDFNQSLTNMRSVLTRILGKSVVMDVDLASGLPTISGNVNTIEQAIMNIILNARDAMPQGGVISVKTSTFTPDPAFLRTHPGMPSGLLVKIQIKDSGVGMDEKTLGHIFEPFFTTKEKTGGSGLGMSIAWKTVKDHGGYIGVSSEPGKGTTVDLYFPAVESSAAGAAAVEEKIVPGSATLLLVEADAMVAETTSKLLTGIGYQVIDARTGEEAIRIFKERQGKVDLVLLGMKLEDTNGLEVFRELKKADPNVRAILCTGYSLRGYTDAMFRSGLRGYLLKPYTLEALSTKIDQVLKER